MLSRVADSIFWINRLIERAENVARFIDVNLNLSLDLGEGVNHWEPLVYTTGDQELFYEHYDVANERNVVQFLTFDERNPNSILSCLKVARENARMVREIISSAMWEEINKFYLMLRGSAADDSAADSPYEFFNRVKLASHLFVGVMDATMSHGEAWHFARMGRFLERADKTSRILDVKYFLLLPNTADVGTPLDTIQWLALLKSASALEMYRKRRGRIAPEPVAEFLILDLAFPRAMHFCLIRAEESLHAITGTSGVNFRTAVERQLGRLRAEFDYAQIGDIFEQGLHEFIDRFQSKLNLVGDTIQQAFFSAAPLSSVQLQKQMI